MFVNDCHVEIGVPFMPEETSVIEGEDLDGKRNENELTCDVTTDTCVTGDTDVTCSTQFT